MDFVSLRYTKPLSSGVRRLIMRFLVYVNTNPDRKHITIHCEKSKSCGHVFQQLIAQQTSANPTISTINNSKEVIKIAETDNSYWLVIWASDLNSLLNNPALQNIAQNLGVTPLQCQHCC